jgi:cholesterol oxidase
MRSAYEVAIIGSGFGGSIPAMRLAQAQKAAGKPVSVCVLEKGKRYNLGEFPRDLDAPKDWFWREEGEHGWRGLVDFRTFNNISVGCASGVGGTSLMYLDVQIDAFDSDFEVVTDGVRRWPASIPDWKAELAPYYHRMRQMMHPSPMPEPNLKARAMQAAAAAVGAAERFRMLDLAIYWGRNGSEPGVLNPDPYGWGGPPQYGCSNCGECFIGCNTHSKNTLDLSYLWFAEHLGAEVYSQHQVLSIAPEDGAYRVAFKDMRWGFEGSLLARRVIVAGGCLGSSQLLLRTKHGYRRGERHYAPTLPKLSDKLGHYFSGNGDFGAVGFKTGRVINPMDGPTITSTIEYGDCRDQHGRNIGFIVEDGGFPDLLRENLQSLPGGLSTGRRLIRWLRDLVSVTGHRKLAEGIFDQLDLEASQDALPFLVMGQDAADGDMSLDDHGDLQITWPEPASMPLWRAMEHTLRGLAQTPSPGLGGNLMLNPTWSAQKQLITLHPLGGCPMGDDPAHGVVDAYGEVFHYPNLFVTDGSAIPTAVGRNPSKTIGALAERVSDKIVERGI